VGQKLHAAVAVLVGGGGGEVEEEHGGVGERGGGYWGSVAHLLGGVVELDEKAPVGAALLMLSMTMSATPL